MILTVDVSIEDLVSALTDSGEPDKVMALIQGLDRAMSDYEFTLNLAKYLVKELKADSPADEPFRLEELL